MDRRDDIIVVLATALALVWLTLRRIDRELERIDKRVTLTMERAGRIENAELRAIANRRRN